MKKLIRAGQLIDGTGGLVRENVDLLIEGSRIADIQPRGEISDMEARIIDAEDKRVLPGLIDVHVHLCFLRPRPSPGPEGNKERSDLLMRGVRNARLALEGGITTIRTVGTADDLDFALRDAIEEGIIPGPRIMAGGQVICITGGHCHSIGIEVDGTEEIRKAVRGKIKSGSNVIKLMVTGGIMTLGTMPGRQQLNRDELDVAIEEAHRAGIKVCGHADGIQGVNDAIAAGIDCIEHGNFMNNEEGLQMLLERGTFLVPTLMIIELMGVGKGDFTEVEFEKARMGLEYNRVGFQRALEVGAKIAMGSDLMEGVHLDHGQGWRELIYMVENGMSPMQAIVAGTKNGAELLGLEEEIGTLEVGKQADLIVVDGDPVEDISQIENLVLVMKDGMEVAGELCTSVGQ